MTSTREKPFSKALSARTCLSESTFTHLTITNRKRVDSPAPGEGWGKNRGRYCYPRQTGRGGKRERRTFSLLERATDIRDSGRITG